MISNLTNLQKGFPEGEFKTSKASAVSVTVDVAPSPLIEKFAQITLDELYRMANKALSRELDQLESDSILKYYKTLTYLRVLTVNRGFTSQLQGYRDVYRSLVVPSFLYQMLVCIGEVRDEDYNIVFSPAYPIKGEDLLPLADLIKISELLIRFETLSYEIGGPNNRGGELAFMAMHHVNGQVTSYRKDHPLFGFLASFFQQEEFNQVTGTMCRIYYGDSSDYALMMATVLRKVLFGGDRND